MLHHYKNCMAVFFGPYDEDYGYVTLEAMQAAKPVITCTDSGVIVGIVDHNETGFIVSPCAQEIAEVIDLLSSNSNVAKRFGCSALEKYNSLNFSWIRVVKLSLINSILYVINMKIAICHEHIFDGDAVGNDIVGMAKVLTNLGIKTILIGENISESISKVQTLILDHDNLI